MVCALARSGLPAASCAIAAAAGISPATAASSNIGFIRTTPSGSRRSGRARRRSRPPAQNHRIVADRPHPSQAAARTHSDALLKHPLQQAEFVQSVADDAQLPPPGPPEVAFAGRSNAGKSSAINALAARTRLAFASRTPGRTQQINYFRLRSGALVADLPGYGYAAVPHALKRHWQAFLGRYVATRQSLVGLVLIVDARHGLAASDTTLLSGYLASGRP